MITNGTSVNAIARGAFSYSAPSQRCSGANCASGIEGSDLTYLATGGLASFPIGVLDTHFSERNREARLIVLTAQTGARYGFGVDETTALFTRFNATELDYYVVGAGGVFAVDNHFSRFIIEHSSTGRQSSYAGLVNFLPSDSRGTLNFAENRWSANVAKQATDTKTQYSSEGIWRTQALALCENAEPIRFRIDNYDVLLQPNELTSTLRSSEHKPCGYLNLPYAIVGVNE
ncbi:hypothetical protein QTP81_03075 [Alteromonas sp. ASW11-36]|uniref:Cyanophycinase n=1 Tax=Alteromonas arenosi TaxID=3055817 RepID=A0ABT7STQ9_9ALTE|nr:hypothetical protein [Alteromonas sp. ASW11-36]MDM7859588.1 hypothetical protein [Alteromonas sp. ASW11-36]